MAVPDCDLRRHPPRGPREELGGLYFLARTIDKARAKLAGTLGPYKIGPGISVYLFEWLGIGERDFMEAVRANDDDASVVRWIREHSNPDDYAAINEKLATRALRDEEHRRQMLPSYPVLQTHPDLTNWFDIFELDDREAYESAARRGGMAIRYVTFSQDGAGPRPGVIDDGDLVRPFAPGVPSLHAFVALDDVQREAEMVRLGAPVPLADVTLHAPLRPNKNVFCVGRNYLAHVEEGAAARGNAVNVPTVPQFFTKAPTAIADPDAPLRLSDVSEQYDWEAELAVVIGTRCRDVNEADALGVIFGYTCLNDVTARDLQHAHGQWFKGKSLDDSCPLGPWIVPAYALGDPQGLEVSLRVNGVVKQHAPTSSMIFSVKRIIADLSRGLTLEAGDIIATGTPEGVGFARKPPEFLKDGDLVEVEVEKIGVLRNRISLPQNALSPVARA